MRTLWLAVCAMLIGVASAAPASTPVSLAVGSAVGEPGTRVTVDVAMTSAPLVREDGITSYQLELHWNPAVLAIDTAATQAASASGTLAASSPDRMISYGWFDGQANFACAGSDTLAGSAPLAKVVFILVGGDGTSSTVEIQPRNDVIFNEDASLVGARVPGVVNIIANHPPVITGPSVVSGPEAAQLRIELGLSDPDGNPSTFRKPIFMPPLPVGAAFDSTSGVFTWIPTYTQSGTYIVTFLATDNKGARATFPVTIVVANVARPIVLTLQPPGNQTVREGKRIAITAKASDPDGEGVSIEVARPAGSTWTAATGEFAWTPGGRASTGSPYLVTFTARTISQSKSAKQDVTIAVLDSNFAPVMPPIPDVTANVGQPAQITATATDPDGDAITYSDNTTIFAINASTGVAAFTPALADSGVFPVAITANDGKGGVTTRTFTLTVAKDRKPPYVTVKPTAQGITTSQATIMWVTDELSTSVIRFGLAGGALGDPVVDTRMTTAHSVTLTGLLDDKLYQYVVWSVDDMNNRSAVETGTFRTLAKPVILPLLITSRPTVDRSMDFAFVSWETNRFSTSVVRWGLAKTAITDSTTDGYGTSHSVAISPLTPATRYYFNVRSVDAVGLSAVSAIDSFTTKTLIKPPVIKEGPGIAGRSDSTFTIAWVTDRAASSRLEYGMTAAYSQFIDDPAPVTAHRIMVTGLVPDTEYHFRVASTGPERQAPEVSGPTFSGDMVVRTMPAADRRAPIIIEGPTVPVIDDKSATIAWKTDELAQAAVEYGTTVAGVYVKLGDIVVSTAKSDHSVMITGLMPQTTYEYTISLRDQFTNGPTVAKGSFTTRPTPDTKPPKILGTIGIAGITDRSAIVTWTMDEPANARVTWSVGPVSDFVDISAYRKDHSVTLTGLEAATRYTVAISGADPARNPYGPVATQFTTKAKPDTLPPVLVAWPDVEGQTLDSLSNRITAVLTAKTNEPASVTVYWGFHADTLHGMVSVASYTTEQRIQLTGLPTERTILFRAVFTDASERANTLRDHIRTFRTIAGLDKTPPTITRGPLINDVTPTGFTASWHTDESAISRLWIGPNQSSLAIIEEDPRPKRVHQLTTTSLAPGTRFYWRVSSVDPSGNRTPSRVDTVRTAIIADAQPPVFIEGPFAVYESDDVALIDWTTDEDTQSEIYFAMAMDSTYAMIPDQNFLRKHTLQLVNLDRGQSYVFFIRAIDRTGNSAVAGDSLAEPFADVHIAKLANGRYKIAGGRAGTFTTSTAPDVSAPVITGPPQVESGQTGATISWQTNETSNSTVRYLEDTGTAGKPGRAAINQDDLVSNGTRVFASDYVTSHQVALTGLAPGKRYVFHVASSDPVPENPETRSELFYLTTAQEADLTPPQIVEGTILATPSQTQALIRWETNELATSRVSYGAAGNLSLNREVSDLTKVHQVVLTNLAPDSAYSFRVLSADQRGNVSETIAELSFRTAAVPDIVPPEVSGVTVVRATDKTATISWQTNEPASTFIEFGQSTAYGLSSVNPTLATAHEIVLANLGPATTYHFRVSAVDRAGLPSTPSTDATFNTEAEADLVGPTAPATVDTIPAAGRVILQWAASASADIANYTVYRNGAVIASGIGGTRYVDLTAANDTRYAYEIAGMDWTGNTGDKSVPVFETPAANEAPAAPLPASSSPVSGTTMEFNVGNVTRAISRATVSPTYTFVLAEDSLFQNTLITIAGVIEGDGSTIFHVDTTNFTRGTTYWWAAQAYDGVANGPLSDKMSFTWQGPTAIRLAAFTATSARPGVVEISWTLNAANGEIGGVDLLRGATAYDAKLLRAFGSEGARGVFVDASATGRTVNYWLRVSDRSGGNEVFGPVQANILLPGKWALEPARPNPFNPTTAIVLAVPAADEARVFVYNLLGQPVATLHEGPLTAGIHRFIWMGTDREGRSMASGVYLIVAETKGGIRLVQRATLVR